MTINSRNKGHAFELKIAKQLTDIGYQAVTSRSESRSLDNAGVDLVDNTPFYFQMKAVEALRDLNGILARMPTESALGTTKMPVVVHKKNNKPPLVTMTWEDFKKLALTQEKSAAERISK